MRGFVIKEFFHIFRDFRTLLILFGMPIAQILLFGFAITTEIKDASIAVYDPSRDEVTRSIIDKISGSGYFKVYDHINGKDELEELFRKGKIKLAILFEQDFAATLVREGQAPVQIIADASDPNNAGLVVNYTMGILNDYMPAQMPEGVLSSMIDVEYKMLYNPELKSVFMFVPGIITILLMLVCAMMTSISIAREKELGTMEILLVSPLKPLQIILGKVTPYLVLSFVNAISILLIGYFVFQVPMRGSLILLLGEVTLFIFMALSLGLLISSIAKTQQVALMISLAGLMLPTILLSGFIFPIENMPVVLQVVSNLMPPRWFIIIIKDIMLKGVGLSFIWKETLILAGMTLFFIFLSVKKFKVRLA